MPDYVSLSNVFIDDILLSDGQVFLGVLGGAGVHAMAGARVWSKSLGLIASIGEDFEPSFEETLRKLGLDTSMLQVAQEKTTRAWQIFQPDEERIEVYRDKNNRVHQVSLETLALPHAYQEAGGFHVHFSGSVEKVHLNLRLLSDQDPQVKIVFEPTPSQTQWGKSEYAGIMPFMDLFSPNSQEGEAITGKSDPLQMADVLLGFGAATVAIRMGEKGSLVVGKDLEPVFIPAVKTQITDVTGAGNAYLGGLLVGLCEGHDPVDAACRGAVSASFAIEQYGICLFNEQLVPERDRRLSNLKNKMHISSSHQ